MSIIDKKIGVKPWLLKKIGVKPWLL